MSYVQTNQQIHKDGVYYILYFIYAIVYISTAIWIHFRVVQLS